MVGTSRQRGGFFLKQINVDGTYTDELRAPMRGQTKATKLTKKFSSEQRKRAYEVVAGLAMHSLGAIDPHDYGAPNMSAAMDRIMVTFALRKCEADAMPCTAARLQRELRMPETNVRRALSSLVTLGLVRRRDRLYVTVPEEERDRRASGKLDTIAAAILKAARDLVELDGSRLLVTDERKSGPKGGESIEGGDD